MIYNLSKYLYDKNFNILCIHGASKKTIDYDSLFNENRNKNIDFINTKLLQSFRSKNHVFRFIFEVFLSIILTLKCLLKINKTSNIDLIIWYGPSSFLWLPVFFLKIKNNSKVYYIQRDIFPDWLYGLGIIKNKLLKMILNFLTYPQYMVPDIIGVETEFNKKYLLKKKIKNNSLKIEVLDNWPSLTNINTIYKNKFSKVSKSFLNYLNKQKKIYNGIYLGNTSQAHDYLRNVTFLYEYNKDTSVKRNLFIHVFGKINESQSIQDEKFERNWGLIPENEIEMVLKNSNFAIVTLNRYNITENIPGKFVTYAQNSLPVLCFANKNSSLSKIIRKYNCGEVIDIIENRKKNLEKIKFFFKNLNNDNLYKKNMKKLFEQKFSTKQAADQIIKIINVKYD